MIVSVVVVEVIANSEVVIYLMVVMDDFGGDGTVSNSWQGW